VSKSGSKGRREKETGTLVRIDEKLFCDQVGCDYIEGLKERVKNSPVVVCVDPAYFRPTEVDLLIGDPTKSNEKLGWYPEYDLDGLISDMIKSDIKLMQKERYLRDGGYETLNYFE
jgi:GDPmannose 4,6-dehydratase